MGRPRKPTHLHVIEGTRTRTDRSGEAALGDLPPLGDPPRHLSREERAAWRSIVDASPDGVLSGPDRIIMEVAARLLALLRAGELPAAKMPVLTRVLASLGMTPVDRSRIAPPAPPKPEGDDPWDRFNA